MLFYVWEDAGVWTHWNHSSDIHLSYPGWGASILHFLIWSLLGCTAVGGVAVAADSLVGKHPVFTLSSLGADWDGCNGMAWCCNDLCLLIRQVAFLAHRSIGNLFWEASEVIFMLRSTRWIRMCYVLGLMLEIKWWTSSEVASWGL